ncbi:MAG: YqgE/AlgH family protein [Flavobacteriaceae bacterium]
MKGKLLIAHPSMLQDMVFGRAVILIVEHNLDGTVGFILNKPIPYVTSELIPDIEVSFPIAKGGPVEQDNMYFIHSKPEMIPDSVEIADGIFWGGNFEAIKQHLNKGTLSEKDIRFFLGYSGWDFGQLERELEENAWLITENPYRAELIEKTQPEFWKEKLEDFGEKYLIWSNAPENPEMN